MAGRRCGTRRRRWAGPVVAALLVAPACSAPGQPADVAARDIQRALDRRAAAVVDRDEAAYLDVLDPRAGTLRAAERREFRNLADVPLRSWEYRLTGLDRTGAGRVTAQVELRYRFEGYDGAPVKAATEVELAERDGRWYVAADRTAAGSARQLWEQGKVTVVRGTHSLVLGTGQDAGRLRAIADTADRAVPAVDRAWPEGWARRLVVLVPSSVDAMGSLLGAPAAAYRGIAAVTTGESVGSGRAPADRVIVNPEAYAVLGDFGRRLVLTHESTHVATRAHTSAATPMWLSEGFADWVAYRDTGRTAAQAAPELRRAVHAGEVPADAALPADKDFGFGGDAEGLGRAYESGWLACELIAERWGEEKLTAFYRAVGAERQREGAVEKAMRSELGTTLEDFTVGWREYLGERLA
ncbi:hypothetical protein [Streptomyces spiramyceticus]|uniref:hypothetical protein n=1 Tax=Streptomyces spiramyceticus TaxID=299717 RepID=UPI00237A7EC5|nr:hypothetical protein [Streptomyces spiramyceticus]